jgi:hypothetical protein
MPLYCAYSSNPWCSNPGLRFFTMVGGVMQSRDTRHIYKCARTRLTEKGVAVGRAVLACCTELCC